MRKYLLSLGLAIVLLTSCNPDDGPTLTPDLVTSVKAYDLDNNGNSSDIRVNFVVSDNINVFEYRVMVIPSNTSSSFTVSLASGIPESNYLEVNTVPFENKYPISRLPSNLLDVNGDQIINGVEYVVAIFVFGTGSHQLSGFSNPFTLKNQGIYNARYFINFNFECTLIDNTVSMRDSFADPDGFYFIDLELVGGIYKGVWQCPTCEVAPPTWDTYSFVIEGTTLNITSEWNTYTCGDLGFQDLCGGIDMCTYGGAGSGTIQEDLLFSGSMTVEDCIGTCQYEIFFTRQV